MVVDGVQGPKPCSGRPAGPAHRSLEISRSKRLRALGRRGGWGATRWLRRSAWWMEDTAGGSIPRRASSAWILRAPHRGWAVRIWQMVSYTEGFILPGEVWGRRDRSSSPGSPSARYLRRYW